MPGSEKGKAKNIYQVDFDKERNPTTPEDVALWEELDGKTTYHQSINKSKYLINRLSKIERKKSLLNYFLRKKKYKL